MVAIPEAHKIDLARATVVVREAGAGEAEKTAVTALVEEVEKRTGIRWAAQGEWPEAGAVIVATSNPENVGGSKFSQMVLRATSASL